MAPSRPWLTFADPELAFSFEFPAVATSGEAIDRRRNSHAGGQAVHLSTADGREVYFELDRTGGRSAESGLEFLARDVSGRFADAWFGPVEETTMCGLPARSVRFKFADRVRWVIFAEHSGESYRVIVDPRSNTNLQILGSLRLRD